MNPLLLTRLEALLDLWILQVYPEGVSLSPDRQMLARPGWTTLTFFAPEDLHDAWTSALHRLRDARGPLPTWACAVLLIHHALDVWLTTDPSRQPAEHRVLERDDYLCRAPGCSSRRNLEVHHIHFRSQGGSDDPGNKITLCHAHHHHAVHAGTLRLTGSAPGDLTWELGTRNGRPPFWTLKGDKLIRRRIPGKQSKPYQRPTIARDPTLEGDGALSPSISKATAGFE